MEVVIRNEGNELCIKRVEGIIKFRVANQIDDWEVEFSTTISEYKTMKSFVEDGLWEYEKSLEDKKDKS